MWTFLLSFPEATPQYYTELYHSILWTLYFVMNSLFTYNNWTRDKNWREFIQVTIRLCVESASGFTRKDRTNINLVLITLIGMLWGLEPMLVLGEWIMYRQGLVFQAFRYEEGDEPLVVLVAKFSFTVWYLAYDQTSVVIYAVLPVFHFIVLHKSLQMVTGVRRNKEAIRAYRANQVYAVISQESMSFVLLILFSFWSCFVIFAFSTLLQLHGIISPVIGIGFGMIGTSSLIAILFTVILGANCSDQSIDVCNKLGQERSSGVASDVRSQYLDMVRRSCPPVQIQVGQFFKTKTRVLFLEITSFIFSTIVDLLVGSRTTRN